ncbi:unnamed protein product [Cuscuta epithymum]|uniref:NHL repeat-containing protein n=1 Tax=Cuscuta epithymum TaxID=186058 RepID=A0AAV0GI27_9ASTE|nr:unnamed protein product [Cuscuta epithymum]
MRVSFFLLSLLALFSLSLHLQVFAAAPAGPLIKHLSSLFKLTSRTSSSKVPQSEGGNVLQFEDGYLVETVVRGNELGVVPYKIRVSQDGELVAVDASRNNIVKITPPLSQYCRARLVAGSFKGHKGHVDGKPSEARFNNPRGVVMDDKGNVYVADTSNLAIRKIGESGVTTIAGGKSHSAGYRDGPSDEAQFSNDFDVVYVQQTCSLLIVDRGNAAIRQISLYQEDCDYEQSSVSTIDIFMVIGAVVIGYAVCMLQQGFGSTIFSTLGNAVGREDKKLIRREKVSPVVEMGKGDNEVVAGWPSFGQLIWDLANLSLEAVSFIFTLLNPLQFRSTRVGSGLTPLKDSLIMPEDEEVEDNQERRVSAPVSEITTRPVHPQSVVNSNNLYKEVKTHKHRSSSSIESPQSTRLHRSTRHHDYQAYYASSTSTEDAQPSYQPEMRSKSQGDKVKHRRPEKSARTGMDPKYTGTKGLNPALVETARSEQYYIRNNNPPRYQ